jgi:hypothetical protein
MPERKRPQKPPHRRRRRHPTTQQPPGLGRAKDLTIIDAVRAQHHREDQRHHLARSVRGTRSIPSQPRQPPRERLDPQPRGEH